MIASLRTFFRAETHPLNLAVLRVIVFSELFRLLYRTDFERHVRVPEGLRWPPRGYGPFFDLLPFGVDGVMTLRLIALAASLLAVVGLFSRISASVAVVSSVYLLLIPNMFGKVTHTHHHLVWFGALLAAGPPACAASLDSLMSRVRWRRGGGPPLRRTSRVHALPIRFAWLLLGVAYLFPGIAKLLAGPEWVFSDNLKFLMWEQWQDRGVPPLAVEDVAPWITRAAAAATVLWELTFVVLIFRPRLRWLAVAGGVAFHLSIRSLLRIDFLDLVICYAAFVDWHALWVGAPVLRKIKLRALAKPAPPGVLDLGAERRLLQRTFVMGWTLVAVNAVCGAADFDSWPFSTFPRFETVRTEPVRTRVEMFAVEEDGTERPLRSPLRRKLPGGIVRRLDEPERTVKLRALQGLLLQRGRIADLEQRVRYYFVTRSTDPDDRDAEPIRREFALEYP